MDKSAFPWCIHLWMPLLCNGLTSAYFDLAGCSNLAGLFGCVDPNAGEYRQPLACLIISMIGISLV
jgi:hypothetical protein